MLLSVRLCFGFDSNRRRVLITGEVLRIGFDSARDVFLTFSASFFWEFLLPDTFYALWHRKDRTFTRLYSKFAHLS